MPKKGSSRKGTENHGVQQLPAVCSKRQKAADDGKRSDRGAPVGISRHTDTYHNCRCPEQQGGGKQAVHPDTRQHQADAQQHQYGSHGLRIQEQFTGNPCFFREKGQPHIEQLDQPPQPPFRMNGFSAFI